MFNPIGGGDFNLENTLFPDENWVPYTRAFGYSLAGGNFNADAEGGQEKDPIWQSELPILRFRNTMESVKREDAAARPPRATASWG